MEKSWNMKSLPKFMEFDISHENFGPWIFAHIKKFSIHLENYAFSDLFGKLSRMQSYSRKMVMENCKKIKETS